MKLILEIMVSISVQGDDKAGDEGGLILWLTGDVVSLSSFTNTNI